jgi:hypothetical protein
LNKAFPKSKEKGDMMYNNGKSKKKGKKTKGIRLQSGKFCSA